MQTIESPTMWLLLAILACTASSSAQNLPDPIPTATFFISLSSRCQYGNTSLAPGSSFEEGGSLCAYVEDADILYSCPAGDEVCWNTGGQCTGGDDSTAGDDQTACSDIGAGNVKWCCNRNYGNCTQTTYQQNNCWSWFPNPNRGINSLAASSSASVAMQIALTRPSLTNIVVSTSIGGGWKVLAADITTSVPTASNTASSSPTSTSPIPTAVPLPSSDTSLSGGATAGIAIAAAVAGSIGALTAFYFWNRKRREEGRGEENELSVLTYSANSPKLAEAKYCKSTSPLLDSVHHTIPAELSGSQEPQELSSHQDPRA